MRRLSACTSLLLAILMWPTRSIAQDFCLYKVTDFGRIDTQLLIDAYHWGLCESQRPRLSALLRERERLDQLPRDFGYAQRQRLRLDLGFDALRAALRCLITHTRCRYPIALTTEKGGRCGRAREVYRA